MFHTGRWLVRCAYDRAGWSSSNHAQAALTEAVEGEPTHSRRSLEAPHNSRHSLGSGSGVVDVDEKSAKAVAAYRDPRVSLTSTLLMTS